MKKLILKSFVAFLLALGAQYHASAQGTYLMCSTSSTSDTSGTLYDSGGLSGDYLVSEDCTLLVAPTCATSITLTFQQFNTESGWDFFHVYDGQTTSAPELLNVSGTTIPSPVTCTSGYMLIVWHSDFTIVAPGFQCSWSSVIAPSTAPTAAFSVATMTPPLEVGIQFTDNSTGNPTAWLWDFGNGDTAHSQNPVYAYSSSGNYTVTLIAFTCNESDTITHSVNVQGPPDIDVNPASGFSASVQCGDSSSFNLGISNVSGGQLVYSLDGSLVGPIKVLALTYGVDLFQEYPRTIAAIDSFFTNYTLTPSSTTNPGTLSGLLVGTNVLLIPEHETGNDSVWFNFGPVIRQYLNNGGSVIFLGSFSSYASDLFLTGVFTGTFIDEVSNLTMTLVNNTDPITTGLTGTSFTAPSATYSMGITNPDKVVLVHYQGNDVVCYRYFGSGKAIFIGFDYFNANTQTRRIIANAVEWGGENALPSWIHMSKTSDTVDAGQTSNVTITFVASGLPAGTYYANIGIQSNDPDESLVVVPCTLTVSGDPIIALSDSCLNLGQVMQYTTARDTFSIINTGCDTLFVSSVTSTNPNFVINANFAYLLPGAYADAYVTFSSSTVGIQTGMINILNNDIDTTICLSADVRLAPIVTPSVSSVTENLRACSDTGSTTFTITNSVAAGGHDLTFTLGNLPTWVTATPSSGTLPAGASITITLHFSSGLMPGGAYNTNVSIISNDPQAPTKNVPTTLNVDFNPCMAFTFTSNTCTGFSNFTSTSINTPTSYLWDFGDNSTSTDPNPSHPYALNGNYNVTLIACNASGCDTVVQPVQAIITGPKATSCYPVTQAYCCGIGITLFKISGPFGPIINNISNDGIVSYEDFTCTDTGTLITNYPYAVVCSTGFTYPEIVKVWIDLNNDGALDTTSEIVFFNDTVTPYHEGTMVIPSLPTNVYGVPLRMRVASDYQPSPLPCLDPQFGQHEDYSIFLNFFDGVKELNFETGFKVFPNPFTLSTKIEYALKHSSKVSLEVYNMLGEKVESIVSAEMQSSGKHSYDFTGQPSGIYFVKLSVDNKSTVEKIIKM